MLIKKSSFTNELKPSFCAVECPVFFWHRRVPPPSRFPRPVQAGRPVLFVLAFQTLSPDRVQISQLSPQFSKLSFVPPYQSLRQQGSARFPINQSPIHSSPNFERLRVIRDAEKACLLCIKTFKCYLCALNLCNILS